MKLLRNLRLAAAAVLAVSASQAAAADEYPRMSLKFATFLSQSVPQSSVIEWWADQITERSGGNIKIQIFWSGTLGKGNEILSLVGDGGVELGQTAAPYYPAELPLTAMPNNLPMVFTDHETAVKVAMAGLDEAAVSQEIDKQGVKLLFYQGLSTYHIACTKPVSAIADLQGLKIRSYGEFIPKMWESVGAVGVSVASAEIYEGLQRGNLDCAYWPLDFLNSYKLYEPAKYVSKAEFGAVAGNAVFVTADLWSAWPQEVRDLFEQVSAEAVAMDMKVIDDSYAQALEELKDKAELVEFTEQERLWEVAPDFLDLWVESMDGRGMGDSARKLADIAAAALAE